MRPHVSGTEHEGFSKARRSRESGSSITIVNFPFSAFCGKSLLWTSVGLYMTHTFLSHKNPWADTFLHKCRRPPRYVPYKGTYVPYDGTYGAPDQGQMLDVWGRHPDNVNPKVKIPRFVTLSDRLTDSIFLSYRKKLNQKRYRQIRFSTTILDHTDKK